MKLTLNVLSLLLAHSCLTTAVTIPTDSHKDIGSSNNTHINLDKRVPPTSGPLYGHGQLPLESDVSQGGAGNCWLAASVQLVGAARPTDIQSLLTIRTGTIHAAQAVTVQFPDSLTPTRNGYRRKQHPPVTVQYDQGGRKSSNKDLMIKPHGNWWPGALQRAMERVLGPQALDAEGSDISLSLKTLLSTPVVYMPLNNGNEREHLKNLDSIRSATEDLLTVLGTRRQTSADRRREFLKEPGVGGRMKIDRFFVAQHAYGVLQYRQEDDKVLLLNPWGITPKLGLASSRKWYRLADIAPYLTGLAQEES